MAPRPPWDSPDAPRPPWEEKRRCGALLRLRGALLVRAAAKDIKLSPEAARASVDTGDSGQHFALISKPERPRPARPGLVSRASSRHAAP